VTAHWGVADPAAVKGTDAEQMHAFRDAFRTLENRIKIFASLPIAKLDRLTLGQRVQAIGRDQLPAAADSGRPS
jgi:arsenate reductase